MRILLIVLSVISLVGCNQISHHRSSEKEKLADKIIEQVASQSKKEFGLVPSGTGGQMMDDIKMLYLSFHYRKPVSIEEGRKLLVSVVDKFAAAVNASDKIRPYLSNYPFGPGDIQIEIFIDHPDGSDLLPQELSVISANRGVLEYEIDNPETKLFTTVYSETYDEAVRKIAQAHQQMISE